MSACVCPFHFTSRSSTTVRAGMLMPGPAFGGEHHLEQRLLEELDHLLNSGSMPAWCAAIPRRKASLVAETDREQISFGMTEHRSSTTRAIRWRSSGTEVSQMPLLASSRTASSVPAWEKMPAIAGSRSEASGGRRHPPARGARWTRTFATTPGSIQGVPLGDASRRAPTAAVRGSPAAGRHRRRGQQAVVGHHLLPQRNRPMLLEDDLRVPRTVAIQAPNSSTFETVADSAAIATDSGSWMISSSQTAPRSRSAVVHLVEHHVSETGQGQARIRTPCSAGPRWSSPPSAHIAVDADITGQQTHVVSPYCATRSRYFWLDRALIGV